MHVVGHQTPPQEADTRVAQILPQEPKIPLAAFIAREGFAPVHATLCDVASDPGSTHRFRRAMVLRIRPNGMRNSLKNCAAQAVPFPPTLNK